HPPPPGGQRRQHHRVLDGVRGGPRGRSRPPAAEAVRFPGRRRGADRARRGGPVTADHRHRDPDRQPGLLGEGGGRPRRLRRADRRGHRPADPRRVPAARPRGRGVRGAGERGERGRVAGLGRGRPGAGRVHGGLHGHRPRPERPGLGHRHRPGAAHRRRGPARRRPRAGAGLTRRRPPRRGPRGAVVSAYVPSVLSVLTRHRDFRRLFLAELVVFGGDWFAVIPLLVLLTDLTGRGLWGSLALAAGTGVLALLLPYAGTLADRLDRRRIMVVTALAALVAVALLLTVRSPAVAWLGPVAIGLMGAAQAFFSPAALAALPHLVPEEDLATANAIAAGAWGTMLVVGASLGGVIASLVGAYVCFVITAACLAMAALLVARIRHPMQSGRPE